MMCPTCNEDTMVPVKNSNWAVCPKCGGTATLEGGDADSELGEDTEGVGRDWVLRLVVVIAVVFALVMSGQYCGWWG
ncbi:MAG: hypothetical protein V3R87_11245 [Dehalococcoidia bacterium]